MVAYGVETWGLREAERCCLKVFEMMCLRPLVGITRRDTVRKDEIRRKAAIEETLPFELETQWRIDQREN